MDCTQQKTEVTLSSFLRDHSCAHAMPPCPVIVAAGAVSQCELRVSIWDSCEWGMAKHKGTFSVVGTNTLLLHTPSMAEFSFLVVSVSYSSEPNCVLQQLTAPDCVCTFCIVGFYGLFCMCVYVVLILCYLSVMTE